MTDILPSVSAVRALLRQIQGVREVVVNQGPDGDIRSIEIQVATGQSYRRVTRDVESALLSALGYSIDHKLITVTYNGNGLAVSEASEHDAPFSAQTLQSLWVGHTQTTPHRIELCQVHTIADGELFCDVTVEIQVDGTRFLGHERVADTPRGRQLAAARAALMAIQGAQELETAFVLEGLEEVRIGKHPGLLVLVRARRSQQRQTLQGAVLTEGDPVWSAARAVLDALNRFWVGQSSRAYVNLEERNE